MTRLQRQVKGMSPVILVVLLLGIAVFAVLPGPVSSAMTTWVASLLAPLVEIGGVYVLAGGLLVSGLYFWYVTPATERSIHAIIPDWPPEQPQNPPQITGESFDESIKNGKEEVLVKGVSHSETEPRQQLRSTVREAVITIDGVETPEEYIEAGEWTDDLVAQALLSDSIDYPPQFQLYRWAKPEAAYQHAVQRAINALDAEYNVGNHQTETSTRRSPQKYSRESSVGVSRTSSSQGESQQQPVTIKRGED